MLSIQATYTQWDRVQKLTGTPLRPTAGSCWNMMKMLKIVKKTHGWPDFRWGWALDSSLSYPSSICGLFAQQPCLFSNTGAKELKSLSQQYWLTRYSQHFLSKERRAESTCPTLKISIINSHWLSLLQDRKQQQKRSCCPWKEKKYLRQMEYLSLCSSVPYTFPELCAS